MSGEHPDPAPLAQRLRQMMNGRFSPAEGTYTIPGGQLQNLVLELEGKEPFLDEGDDDG